MTILQTTDLPPVVAISTSESPDMPVLGLSDEHLQDATAEIALNLLSTGNSLAYGGDLRQNGFTELLFELVERYRGHPNHRGKIGITNYTPWPVHIRMTTDELAEFSSGHERSAEIVLLALDGSRITWNLRQSLPMHEPDDAEWSEGLTRMRETMRTNTKARVVLGGRVDGYKGSMPGIAEEALLSLREHQPLFLLGGFGGCARDIAETVGLVKPWAGSRGDWSGRDKFQEYSPESLHNGLSHRENEILAQTPHIQQAATLVTRGLRKVLECRPNTGES